MSLATASLDVFTRQLTAFDAILDKLAAHCEASKIDPAAFLIARLYPDMFPMIRQVQIACDFAKMATARLTGQEPPSHPDVETTIPMMKERIGKVLAEIAASDRAAVDGAAETPVTFRTGPESSMTLPGEAYLNGFILPNFYFHLTTAYAILRHNGLAIGKRDFMGV
jgi:uncharacterized protein